MAEQLIERHASAGAGLLPPISDTPSSTGNSFTMASDALRQAKSCLDSSGKRLRKGEPEHTDEVLSLLRAATDHLRRALDPRGTDSQLGAE
jgi:hypothetical protein